MHPDHKSSIQQFYTAVKQEFDKWTLKESISIKIFWGSVKIVAVHVVPTLWAKKDW